MPGAWEQLVGVWPIAGALVEAFAFALVPLVLVRRKEPQAQIAWILALIFLPGLGAALFLLHGRDRLRWPAKRKRAADMVVASRLSAARRRTLTNVTPHLAEMKVHERRIFRVCAGLGGTTELTPGNHITLYRDGAAAHAAIEDAIDQATDTIFAEYYLVRNDGTGVRFRDKLAKAAERGVDVRLLLDAYGCFWLPGRWFKPLHKAGVKVAEFLPLSWALRLPMNLRTHRKILVVDGKQAFTGGLNVGDEYAGVGAEPWRDTHLSVYGPAVASLSSVFLRDWHFMTGESQADERLFPEHAQDGPATVAVVPSGPDDSVEAIHRTFFAAIVGARRRVWITTPYFVPDRPLLVALETAALRGVDVKMILPHVSNHKVTHQAAQSFYTELLEYGVELYEYLPGMIHSKTMLVDDDITLVGSSNMDMRSFRLNFEVHMLMHDAELARQLEAHFEVDREQCQQIEREAWQARPWSKKVREGAARLISPVL